MDYYHRSNWNEFQWEREIRRDERRISRYFRELASCLDLPGEEELIGGILSDQPDLAPVGDSGSDPLRRSNFWFHDDDDDDDDDDNAPPPRRGGELIDSLDSLATEWNILVVSRLRGDCFLDGLGVGCAYAKLLARAADFLDADPTKEAALKISLGKRSLADLNELAGRLREIAGHQHSLEFDVDSHIGKLGEIRERLFDQLSKLRTA